MPEGDTVFRTARQLASALAGSPLVRADLRHPRLATVDLAGRRVLDVRSVGKHLLIRFDQGVSMHCHLGMDGSWRVHRAGGQPWRASEHQVRAVLATAQHIAVGRLLRQMAVVSTAAEHQLVGHLGPDLLDPRWSAAHVTEAVDRLRRKPDREIGVALLDQSVMAGIGNVYRSEVCFLLGISPWTPVSEVDAIKVVELSRRLLTDNAHRADRSTTGDRRRDRRLWVYGRTRSGCLRCGGRVVSTTQGDRATERTIYFCPICQPGAHG